MMSKPAAAAWEYIAVNQDSCHKDLLDSRDESTPAIRATVATASMTSPGSNSCRTLRCLSSGVSSANCLSVQIIPEIRFVRHKLKEGYLLTLLQIIRMTLPMGEFPFDAVAACPLQASVSPE